MNLLFVTNDAYVPHLAVTLASVFENNKETHFSIFVITTGISQGNHEKLDMFVRQYNNDLFVKTVDSENLGINPLVCGQWGIFPSLKLYACDYFPNVDTMLYMDIDMLCIKNMHIEKLETLDLSNYYVAGTPDVQDGIIHKRRLKIPMGNFYCCAGILIMNLKKWREDNIHRKCMKFFNNIENHHLIKFGEQDVINKVCTGYIYELPIEYNMMSHYYHHTKIYVPERFTKSLRRHKDNAIIIHYIGSNKPWFEDSYFELDKWYKYYQNFTPWEGVRFGHSNKFCGYIPYIKTKFRNYLHRIGLVKNDWAYNL